MTKRRSLLEKLHPTTRPYAIVFGIVILAIPGYLFTAFVLDLIIRMTT